MARSRRKIGTATFLVSMMATLSLSSIGAWGTAAALPERDDPEIETRFSHDEVALLERIRDVQDASGFVSTIFVVKPLVDLLTAADPGELLIGIMGTDLEAIAGAFKGMHLIEACTIRDEIWMWRVVNDDEHSSDEARRFFDRLLEGAESRCG